MKTKHVAGFVSALAVMAVLSGGVLAQTANSNSTSSSGAAANSGSSSGAAAITGPSSSNSGASATGGNSSATGGNSSASTGASNSSATTGNASANTGASNANNRNRSNNSLTLNSTTPDKQTITTNNASQGSGDYTNRNIQSGHTTSDTTLRYAPTVYAPPVSGGNPCTLAVSGGVSVIGWGASAGGTFVDEDCATRQKIAMIHNAGYAGAAKELMCNDKATYNAFKTSGQACAFREAFEPKGAVPQPVAAPVPVVAPVPMVQAPKVYPRCNPRLGIVDNCAS